MKSEIEQAQECYREVIEALNKASLNYDPKKRKDFTKVSSDTGFSSKWLSLMAAGRIDDAGFKRVYLLRAWLRLNGFLAVTTPEHDTTMISEPIAAADATAHRVLARRECLSPAVATFSCSPGSHE